MDIMLMDNYEIADIIMENEGVKAVYNEEEANIAAIVINPGRHSIDPPTVEKYYFYYDDVCGNVATAIMTWLGAYVSNYIMFDTQVRIHEVRNGRVISHVG